MKMYYRRGSHSHVHVIGANICTYNICTYNICTYNICTYNICTYNICTYNMCTYNNVHINTFSLLGGLIDSFSSLLFSPPPLEAPPTATPLS